MITSKVKSQFKFLHLSDIHFNKGKLGEAYELDADLRRKLRDHAKSMADKMGPPDAVLISGDIAFGGKLGQYDDATKWLNDDLCKAIKVDPAFVWCVPGNHDVDQDIVKGKPSHKDVRKKFRDCRPDKIDSLLELHLKEPEVFYDAIAEYNEFAHGYDCRISLAEPSVDTGTRFRFEEGSILRLIGLNSSLISDDDDDPEIGRMIIGSHCCQIDDSPENVNIVMCHHPPDWIRDGDNMREILEPRCSVQLFGHKHQHKLRKLDEGLLVVSAGAVHPSRNEKGWDPRYNWLTFNIERNGRSRKLLVDVYPVCWMPEKQAFDSDLNRCDNGCDFKSFSLKLSDCEPIEFKPTQEDGNEMTVDANGVAIVDKERTLAWRFFQLGYVEQMKISIALDLLSEEDKRKNDHERGDIVLTRAKERNHLFELWEKVEAAHGDARYPNNPFKKE